MTAPHPWRALRGMPHVDLIWRADMPTYLLGASTDDRIWMHSDLTQVERRCVLAHELEHVKRDHDGCQSETIERRVEHHAARYLLPDPALVADAIVWAHSQEEAADVLWVTPSTLRSRLDRRHLHPAEVAIIRSRVARVEWTA